MCEFLGKELTKVLVTTCGKPQDLIEQKLIFQKKLFYMDSGAHILSGITQITLKKLLSENNDLGLAWQLPNHPEVKWIEMILYKELVVMKVF